ncbi:LOW QUALITY PROTEIN: hypothetical protein QTO34_019558, partial [Cnephaeus nilssonii]
MKGVYLCDFADRLAVGKNSAFYVDCESLVQALQELPLSLRLNVAAELVQGTVTGPHRRPFVNFLFPILRQFDGFLSFCFCLSKWHRTHIFNAVIMLLFQTALPLELPQVKPKRNNEGKGLGMQLRGPLGPGGKGSVSELKSAPAGCPGSLGKASQDQALQRAPRNPLPHRTDHLEEELDLLLSLDAPAEAGANILPDQMPQDLESEKDGEVLAQEEKEPSVTEEKIVEPEPPSTSKNVTEEELEDWLD